VSRSRWVGFDHESKENRVSILDREETKKENRNPREKGRRDSPAAVTTVGHGRAEDHQRRRAHWRTTTVVRTGAPELPPSCLDVRAGFGSRAPSPARAGEGAVTTPPPLPRAATRRRLRRKKARGGKGKKRSDTARCRPAMARWWTEQRQPGKLAGGGATGRA